MMAKKLTLDFDDELQYKVIGISSPNLDYKLVFQLNKIGNLKFKRSNEFKILQDKPDLLFSFYIFEDEENMRNIYFLSNKRYGVNLFQRFHQIDFFLIIDSEDEDDGYADFLAKSIKTIPNVLLVQTIDLTVDKSYNQIIKLLEIHFDSNKRKKD